MPKFKKKIVIRPAFDKRNSNPKKNYGIHGAELHFFLIGEKGVIQFKLSTNWQLPHVKQELEFETLSQSMVDLALQLRCFYHPMPIDIGYHSPIPVYEGQHRMDECDFIEGGCYYDGSSLDAEKYFDILVSKGSKGLWRAMKQYYIDTFETPDKEAS